MEDSVVRIKSLRNKFSLTQEALATALGVSFATVNRWENGARKPSALALKKLAELENAHAKNSERLDLAPEAAPQIDFSGNPQAVKAVVEAQRLTFAHTINPVFATEVSSIDPLPHQRIAVYERMLPQDRLRFLLADDAGAGKTIMSGLMIREMLSRQKISRVLIIPPAGLVGNWQKELKELFQLDSRIITGKDLSGANPFASATSIIIISIDTMREEKARALLRSPQVIPYDMVIFDEAHKLSCDQGKDFRKNISKRYKLAEMLAGANENASAEWSLDWHPEHLLLLTATPHMGKDYPYFALWKLLEPKIFTTQQALASISEKEKEKYFIRRAKEEMVHIDGSPLYPMSISDTLGFSLTQGENGEQELYDRTTDYLLNIYNKAIVLNPSAARLALSVFQRRLSSSTYALKRSFERRLDKLDELINQIMNGYIDEQNLVKLGNKKNTDIFETMTADEELERDDGVEENEKNENEIIDHIIAASLADLKSEKEHVKELLVLTERVLDNGAESKFKSLLEIIKSPKFANEKILIFTEHKDTLEFLVRKLSAFGYAAQIAQIHGGMDYRERQDAIDNFRKPIEENGAKYMICTDAAAEGVNLQFCWIMINYDIPWNPARLEQRMGRIHRYGQKHDPVFLMNLVATSTREGKVLATLLEKLEKIRQELSSDKVFDSIGRVFSDVSIKRYMERALLAARKNDISSLTEELSGEITEEQIMAAYVKEEKIFGQGGDVASKLPLLREKLFDEDYRRLLPGFIENFMCMALPLLNVGIQKCHFHGCWQIDFSKSSHAAQLCKILENGGHTMLTFSRQHESEALWTHPGEPFFTAVSDTLQKEYGTQALSGGIFIDPEADKSSLVHVARYAILQAGRATWRLAAIRQRDNTLDICPLEELLCVTGRSKEAILPDAQLLAKDIAANVEKAKAWFMEHARKEALAKAGALRAELPGKLEQLENGFAYQDMELASRRAQLSKKKRDGYDVGQELDLIKTQISGLAVKKDRIAAKLKAEVESIAPGQVEFIAHALIMPQFQRNSPDTQGEDDWRKDDIEQLAMSFTRAHEEKFGSVFPVHTPELARKRNLPQRCGFDVLSLRKLPDGSIERRCIEVKGTRGEAYVNMTENEWNRAMNMGDEYWLYIVANCASPQPRLWRIQNPVKNILFKNIKSNQSGWRIKVADAASVAEID